MAISYPTWYEKCESGSSTKKFASCRHVSTRCGEFTLDYYLPELLTSQIIIKAHLSKLKFTCVDSWLRHLISTVIADMIVDEDLKSWKTT